MGKHWNRRGREARERAFVHSGSKPRARARARHASEPAAVAAARGGAASGVRGFERRLERGCASKRAYRTLQQAADAKSLYDSMYDEESHAYRCRFCGMYHLTTSEGGDGAVEDRFLPAPSRPVPRRSPGFAACLAAALDEAGRDAAWLAGELGVGEDEVRGWLAGDPAGAFRAPEAARALGVGVADLL